MRLVFALLLLASIPIYGQEVSPSPSPMTADPTPVPSLESTTQSPAMAEAPAPPSAAPAGTPVFNAPSAASSFTSRLLGGTAPVLSEEERAGVAVTNAWRDKSFSTMTSEAGVSGSVQFRYGESYPSIVCAILQVTDIELQPGESVTHINVGDTTRWSVESAVSGSGSEQVFHLLVKPRDIGLSTSLVVTTDRRTYHLLLVSDQTEFFHSVSFLYRAAPPPPTSPAAITAAAAAQGTPAPLSTPAARPARTRHHGDGKQVRVAMTEPDNADDSYAISGRADWRPVSVYTKEGKTYLEMPSSMRHREAPVLFEEKKAGWFHHEKVSVNYRVHDKWYVVDRVLDKATLVSGVGGGQEKVDIRRIENPMVKTASTGEGSAK
jgi:P-type conjugative transfer protein TrbG